MKGGQVLLSNYFRYRWSELKQHLVRIRDLAIERLFQKWVLKGDSFIEFYYRINTDLQQKKQAWLDQLAPDQAVVFIIFRDLHWLDWFFPIHHALKKKDSGNAVAVIYVGFSSLLKRVQNRTAFLEYRNQVTQRLLNNGIDPICYFTIDEWPLFRNMPRASLSLTTESIRQENFDIPHRVYVPHYFVLKAGDRLPRNIRYNHVFVPSKPEYSYKESTEQTRDVALHAIGYPKMNAQVSSKARPFDDTRPIVLYAPSLEVDTLLDTLNQGLIEVCSSMRHLSFIFKLHPSLASRRHPIGELFIKRTSGIANILLDPLSNLQEISLHSSLMITDFGSAGAEYRISSGKRVIYLKIPKSLEGGSDLLFRDRFADCICGVQDLSRTIEQQLEKGDLTETERREMTETVLYHPQNAHEVAADKIVEITGGKWGESPYASFHTL